MDFVIDTSPASKDELRWKVYCESDSLTDCGFGNKYYEIRGNLARILEQTTGS